MRGGIVSKYAYAVALIAFAVLLGGVYWKGHVTGGKAVQAKWDADIAERSKAALAAEQAARAREQALLAQKQKVEVTYANARKDAAVRASRAQSELDRLRDELAARDRAAGRDPATSAGTDGAATERELFGQCAAALTGLAGEADRLKARVEGLQGYVRQVCQTEGN